MVKTINQYVLIAFLAATAFFQALPAKAADITVDIGDVERVKRLYSFPNNCNVICFRDWTLEQTVEHYLTQSTSRDGYQAAVSAVIENEHVRVSISGVPASYGGDITRFLDIGEMAYQAASQINADKKWAFDWRFFLPHGMALEKRKSIELLHFPPDYSLTQAQDYLRSNTTDRWADLLSVNGIPAAMTPRYQTIVDISPIAAPADAGSTLSETYSYFQPYAKALMTHWSAADGNRSYPLVAFGDPVRKWIEAEFGVSLDVLQTATLQLDSGRQIPAIGSNHPSYIWYASDPAEHGGNEQEADTAGIAVMGQDLTAACWQAVMGHYPGGDAADSLKYCSNEWTQNKKFVCELFYIKIRKMDQEQAARKCSS